MCFVYYRLEKNKNRLSWRSRLMLLWYDGTSQLQTGGFDLLQPHKASVVEIIHL